MLKKLIRPSIIGVIQCFLLVFLIACIAPLLLKNTHALNQTRAYFQHLKWFFVITHGVFYVSLYLLWPPLIRFIGRQHNKSPSEEQIQYALRARFYLIGTFLIFECLTLLR